MSFETLSDVLEWLENPGSQLDSMPARLCWTMVETEWQGACATVAAQCWMPIETLKESVNENLYYNGYFLMFSLANGIEKVSHGWDEEEGTAQWLFGDGCQMRNPTHWMFLPQPPRAK